MSCSFWFLIFLMLIKDKVYIYIHKCTLSLINDETIQAMENGKLIDM